MLLRMLWRASTSACVPCAPFSFSSSSALLWMYYCYCCWARGENMLVVPAVEEDITLKASGFVAGPVLEPGVVPRDCVNCCAFGPTVLGENIPVEAVAVERLCVLR